MHRQLLCLPLVALFALAACQKSEAPAVQPVVVVPGPTGAPGATGRTGGDTTVIVVAPAASAPN